ESARIAIQGVQPKGTDEKDEAMRPVGKTIKSLFPFYMNASRLGGEPGSGEQVEPEELSLRDLRSVMLDVRGNADKIYSDISESITFNADTNRTWQPDWRVEARTIMRRQQEMVIADLEEKVKIASDTTTDEFMYQDKEEAERELEVAKKILEDMPAALRADDLEYRTWNPLAYHRYSGYLDIINCFALTRCTAVFLFFNTFLSIPKTPSCHSIQK